MSLRLTDEEFDLALKPDVKPTDAPGHWRVIFWFSPYAGNFSSRYPPGIVARFHDDEWMFLFPHPSEAEADERGRSLQDYVNAVGVGDDMRYRRAEFFPDYGSGGA